MHRRLFHLLTGVIASQAVLGQLPVKSYQNGMVVCAYPDASRVGVEILKKGGNAVDAAVAVQFALAVVHPSAGNIGGGGFMVYRSAKGEARTLDFREKAPAKAGTNMYLDAAGNVIPGMSLATHAASGVPGSVDGMAVAHKRYGKLPWAILVQPAVELAAKGFKVTERLARELNNERSIFIKSNPGKSYLLKDTPWAAGDVLVQADLAKTLQRIRDNGRTGFYAGQTADAIVVEMRKGNGLITKEDLANYHSVWRKPVVGNYKGYVITTMPPHQAGG